MRRSSVISYVRRCCRCFIMLLFPPFILESVPLFQSDSLWSIESCKPLKLSSNRSKRYAKHDWFRNILPILNLLFMKGCCGGLLSVELVSFLECNLNMAFSLRASVYFSVCYVRSLCSGDMVFELLKRVDGPTLARAGCSSSLFRNATMDEQLWEQLCSQLWPSSKNPEARSLIQSLGGFRKFYCNCFPMVIDERSFDAPGCGSRFRGREPFFPGFCDDDELQSLSLSDFVSLVDVHYRDKVVYSKITWGMPDAGDFSGWFSNCPFSLNVISSFESGEHSDGQVTISMADGLPEITSLESERKFGKLWNEIWNNFRLSWILVNRREKQAVNLASWKPLGGRKHWPTEKDFVIKFGCVLPAHEILSFHAVQCVLEMRCKISFVGGDGDSGSHASLRITELSLQLEDIDGAHVNGRNSLLILKRAPSCQRTTNFLRILESYHLFLKAKNLFMEKKIRGEGLIDTLSAVGGILAVAGFCFLFF